MTAPLSARITALEAARARPMRLCSVCHPAPWRALLPGHVHTAACPLDARHGPDWRALVRNPERVQP